MNDKACRVVKIKLIPVTACVASEDNRREPALSLKTRKCQREKAFSIPSHLGHGDTKPYLTLTSVESYWGAQLPVTGCPGPECCWVPSQGSQVQSTKRIKVPSQECPSSIPGCPGPSSNRQILHGLVCGLIFFVFTSM